ncbi:MAG: DUF222 domain-containing protein, partial [Gammaproteobacteria bacterium]|nr:DUF222 domain-containing protein [Gammaproteobacteria bacterium]
MVSSRLRQRCHQLFQSARHGTAQHVEMLVRKHQRVQRLMKNETAAQFAGRELRWHYDDDGMLIIRGRLTPEDGALFVKAIDAAFASIFPPAASTNSDAHQEQGSHTKNVSAETFSGTEQPDTFPQKRADALMLLAEHSL